MQRRYLCIALALVLLPSAATARHRHGTAHGEVETVVITGTWADQTGPFPPEHAGSDERRASLDSAMRATVFAKCTYFARLVRSIHSGRERVTVSPLWGYVLRVDLTAPTFRGHGFVCWKGHVRATPHHRAVVPPAAVARH